MVIVSHIFYLVCALLHLVTAPFSPLPLCYRAIKNLSTLNINYSETSLKDHHGIKTTSLKPLNCRQIFWFCTIVQLNNETRQLQRPLFFTPNGGLNVQVFLFSNLKPVSKVKTTS